MFTVMRLVHSVAVRLKRVHAQAMVKGQIEWNSTICTVKIPNVVVNKDGTGRPTTKLSVPIDARRNRHVLQEPP